LQTAIAAYEKTEGARFAEIGQMTGATGPADSPDALQYDGLRRAIGNMDDRRAG